MVLYIIDHPYHYEAENLCRVFYPFDKVTVQHEFMPSDENRTVYTAEENGEYTVTVEASRSAADQEITFSWRTVDGSVTADIDGEETVTMYPARARP